MKFLKLITLAFLGLGLAGCTVNGEKSSGGSSEPEIVEPGEPSEPSEPTEPSEPEDPSEPETPEEPTEPEEPEVVYTAEDIATEFNAGISAYGLSAEFYDIEGVFTGYYLGVSFGESEDDSEENLGGGVYTLASFLPDYLVVFDEEYVAATEEAGAEYDLVLVTENFSAAVELYGYLDEGLLISEIYIYDIAE